MGYRKASRRALLAVVQASFIASSFLAAPFAAPVAAANPSANLDQCANDPLPSSHLDGCNTAATQWVNGNLGASKSVYFEGDSIPYRLTFGNLATSGSHTVKIEWDTTKSSKHAIDYIDTYTQSVANANACLGVTGCGSGAFAATTFGIPADPQVTGGGVTPIGGVFTFYGASIDSVSSYSYSTGTGFTGDKSASLVISFHASVANPVLAWGGHIATRQDWGPTNSAVAISGSPYHTRLLDLDGSGGNQDRSLSADAVIFPAHVTVIKHAVGPSSTAFGFTATGLTPATFSLTDNSASTDASQTFGDIVTFGPKSVSESSPLPGYKLTALACVEDMTQNSTVSITSGGAGGTASISLEEGENVTCTFTNTAQNPHLTITKDATEASYDATTDTIHYTIVATNDGNTTLAAVTVTDTEAVLGTCTPANGSSLAPGESISCAASHAVTQADIDAGTYNNTACVDDGAGGAAQACDDADVPAVQNPHLTITKDATETGFSAVNDVIHYSITATNDGNVTLSNVDVTDSEVTNLSCTPTTPVTSLAPGASITCTASHTITQADIDAGSFYNQACVDDGTGGAAQACDDVTTPGSKNPHLTITKDATEASYDATTDTIHYTIVATNDGNTTLAAVTVTDTEAVLGTCTPANGSSLAPGESISCAASHAVTQADIDAGTYNNTACVDDGAGGAAQACDDADVPAVQNNVLTLTKTDDLNPAKYDHVGQVITYTLTATNSGNTTLHNVSVSDAPALDGFSCTPAIPVASLAPGGTVVCTGTHTITSADMTALSFTDTGSATSTEDNAPDASDTVLGAAPHLGQITPTATTCSVFNAGTADTLSSLQYSVKNGKVSQVAPGVFFYWLKVNVTGAGQKTFTVTQTITTGNFSTYFTQASGSFVYSSSCVKVGTQSISTSGSGTTITYTAPTAGTYIFGIKYSAGSISGATAPSPTPTVHYEFAATGNGVPPNNTQTIDLIKK